VFVGLAEDALEPTAVTVLEVAALEADCWADPPHPALSEITVDTAEIRRIL
jgi:hypothetical protein